MKYSLLELQKLLTSSCYKISSNRSKATFVPETLGTINYEKAGKDTYELLEDDNNSYIKIGEKKYEIINVIQIVEGKNIIQFVLKDREGKLYEFLEEVD